MPDAKLVLSAIAAAAMVAAIVMLVGAWAARRGRFGLATLAEVIAVGAGMAIGCWWLGLVPKVPPVEDQDRLLLVLLPATGIVEIVAAFLRRWPWFGRVMRVLLALLIPALLLFGSGWLPAAWTPGGDPSAPSSWTQGEAIGILTGLGVLLAFVWNLLVRVAERPGGFAVPATLGLVTSAAGVCVILSSYASGGLIGLPFAGVAAGALVACLVLARDHAMTGVVGVGTVLLFGLLMAGRFFGELTTINFALLIVAPLLCWLVARSPLRQWKVPIQFVAAVILCLIPAGVAAGLAYRDFAAATDESSAYGSAASADDAPAFSPATATSVQTGATKEPSASQPANAATSPRDPGAEDAASEPKRSAPIDPGAESKN